MPTNTATQKPTISETTARHSRASQRPAPTPEIKDPMRYKTVMCEKWKATGKCPYTFKCQFAHGEEELRVRQDQRERRRGTRGGRRVNHRGSDDTSVKPSDDTAQQSTQSSTEVELPQRPALVGTGAGSFFGDLYDSDDTLGDALCPVADADVDGEEAIGAPLLCEQVADEPENAVDTLAEDAIKVPSLWQAQSLPEVYAPWVHKLSEEPAINRIASFRQLGLVINAETGKVEALAEASTSFRRETSLSRQASLGRRDGSFRCRRQPTFSTLNLRRSMSALLDELSYEASGKQVVEVL